MEQITPVEAGISQNIGAYSDAVRVPAGHDQIFVSGTPGLTVDGELAKGIVAQSEQVWRNIGAILEAAGATMDDIVSVHHWVKNAADLPAYLEVRKRFVKNKPAYMLGVIPSFVRDEFLVEVEVIAAVPASQSVR